MSKDFLYKDEKGCVMVGTPTEETWLFTMASFGSVTMSFDRAGLEKFHAWAGEQLGRGQEKGSPVPPATKDPWCGDIPKSSKRSPGLRRFAGASQLDEIFDLYTARIQTGTLLTYDEYRVAIARELEELREATTEDDVKTEFGDVLANVLFMGAALGIWDPIQQAWNSAAKVRKRLAYIEERITRKPHDRGYRAEFDQLWEASKQGE